MNELAFTYVDANMAEGAAHGVEEHQITGFEVIAVDLLSGMGLLGSDTRKYLANRLCIDGANQSAAIKAGFGAGTTQAIRNTQEPHGRNDQVRGFFSHVLTGFAYETSRFLGHGVASFTKLGDETAVD